MALPAPPFWLAKTIAFIIVLSCFLYKKMARFRAFGLRPIQERKTESTIYLIFLPSDLRKPMDSIRGLIVVLSFFNERQKAKRAGGDKGTPEYRQQGCSDENGGRGGR